ncbi:Pre-mRNA-splicing factor SLU7 [Babesia sp. Xinjiang]|uniref:Pre-mRNA-splicing factor SLU7 n=1 Tax=Babesia sp. Xinjiang TaxID=462227 RepID=UPI000A2496F3|nr:Pre-mRNA-splicing factor SLU7 [Babesia sp. Xinjiang]ORM39612.1 Pre-mRNA-splicing factor SLU7 [Babesia sp. Xinjiang]
MWMGKIGNKSASFINHKHFHPGNRENLEKVWLAEEKHKAELKRQKEMKERLAEEIRITELKRQLREQEEQRYKEYILQQKPTSKYQVTDEDSKLKSGATGLIITKKPLESRHKDHDHGIQKIAITSSYREDVFEHGHTTVFGSLYDRETGRWGYQCCGTFERGEKCLNKNPTKKNTSKNKKEEQYNNTDDTNDAKKNDDNASDVTIDKRQRNDDDDNTSGHIATTTNKQKRRGKLSMADALDKLKQMDALL